MAHRLVTKSSHFRSQEWTLLSRLCQTGWIILFFMSIAFISVLRQIISLRTGLGGGALDSIFDTLAISPSLFSVPSQDPDRNCPFQNSTIYRSIFVYPSPGTDEWLHNDTGVVTGKRLLPGKYPWDDIDHLSRKHSTGLYDINSQLMQVRYHPVHIPLESSTAVLPYTSPSP
jgi:hypothetical protein